MYIQGIIRISIVTHKHMHIDGHTHAHTHTCTHTCTQSIKQYETQTYLNRIHGTLFRISHIAKDHSNACNIALNLK